MLWHIAMLCAGLVVPVLLFAGILLWEYVEAERTRLIQEADATANGLTIAVNRELSGMIATLRTLATAQSLLSDDIAAFDRRARAVLKASGVDIALRDRAGRQLVNTRLPWGATLPHGTDQEADGAVLETKAPYVSDLVIGAAAQEPVFIVDVPVLRNGEVAYFLNMSVPAAHLRTLMDQEGLPDGWLGSIIDRTGIIVARTRAHDAFVGKPSAAGFIESVNARQGMWRGTSLDGIEVVFVYRRSDLSDWLIGVGVPRNLLEAPLWRALQLLAALGAGMLLVSAVLTYGFGRRIDNALRQLVDSARHIARDEPASRLTTAVTEINAISATLADAANGLRENQALLSQGVRVAHLGIFQNDHMTKTVQWSTEMREILGWGDGEPASLAAFLDRVHDADRAAVAAAIKRGHDPSGDGVFEAEHRIARRDGGVRWVAIRGQTLFTGDGATRRPVRTVGTILDITPRKESEARLSLLAREVDHRAKNLLAVVQVMLRQTRASTVKDYAAAAQGRVAALARAHTLLSQSRWEGADLRRLIDEELLPHRQRGAERIKTEGPAVSLPPRMAQSMSMVLHELATNAAKYGAFSTPHGRVTITWQHVGGILALRWAETGGPPVTAPEHRGFGTSVVELSVRNELDGRVDFDWRHDGLVCDLSIPLRAAQPLAARA